MEIDFDPAKDAWNRAECGFGFRYAARIFLGRPIITAARMAGEETRMKAVGLIEGVLCAVIFADRGDVRRIISARPASRKERREWQPPE